MSAALTAQPGLHSTATAVSPKAKVKGKNKKRKKSTMAGGACATKGNVTEDVWPQARPYLRLSRGGSSG